MKIIGVDLHARQQTIAKATKCASSILLCHDRCWWALKLLDRCTRPAAARRTQNRMSCRSPREDPGVRTTQAEE